MKTHREVPGGKASFLQILIVLSAIVFGLTVTQAEELRRVESADQRWAAEGKGGAPEFTRHVMPLLSKLGCNMRACHGSFQGQNGFRLSLFGFEPDVDRKEMLEVDEESSGDGPRINLRNPADSLVLIKPTSTEEHGGGRRMGTNSWQYRVFHEWIAAGAKFDPSHSAKLVRLTTKPAEIVVTDQKTNTPIRAISEFDDGSVEDVTALTVFSSND